MSERLGVFGGTFDPIHIGHLEVARAAKEDLKLDRVLFVVAGNPWQKQDTQLSPAEDRLAMTEAAVAEIEGFEVTDMEIARGGESYMIDTLKELAEDSKGELFLILGADAANGLSTWERPEEIQDLARLVVVNRPEHRYKQVDLPVGWKAEIVEGPELDISGTQIRERLESGLSVEPLIPKSVLEVMSERNIFGLGG